MNTITKIAIAVIEQDDQFLIGIRPAGAKLAGLWEFAGGKVEPDETPQQAAIREAAEETGLMVEVIKLYEEKEHRYDHGHLKLFFYQCRAIDPSQKPNAPFRWVPRAELGEYEFPEANQFLIQLLLQN